MVAKCFAIFVVWSQISFAVCNSDCTTPVPFETTPAAFIATTPPAKIEVSGAGVTVEKVSKGKYPVALKNYGTPLQAQIPVTISRFNAPTQEKPPIRLPYNIPAPKVISHTCTCYQTILRPRVHQQILTVPSVQRYIQTTHRPVVEQIQYEAFVKGCNNADGKYEVVEVGAQAPAPVAVAQNTARIATTKAEAPIATRETAAPVQFVPVQSAQIPQFSVCTAPVQAFKVIKPQQVQIPQIQTPKIRSVHLQNLEALEAIDLSKYFPC